MCNLISALRRLCRTVVYIWDKDSSCVSYLYRLLFRKNESRRKEPLLKTQSHEETEIQEINPPWTSKMMTLVSDEAYSIMNFLPLFQVHAKQPNVTMQKHEKEMRKVPRSNGAVVIERLSKRYDLSKDVTSRLLQIIGDPTETGEFSFDHEEEKYFVVVRIREIDFDIYLRSVKSR